MTLEGLTAAMWAAAAIGGFIAGMAKAGIPGVGIIVIPIMAMAYGARTSVGTTVPILVVADVFGVVIYRKNVDVKMLLSLIPWVGIGLVVGAICMRLLPKSTGHDPFAIWIGSMVLIMVALTLLGERFAEKWATSKVGGNLTGMVAGFSTITSNAAGPIMTAYFAAARVDKHRFMGTIAYYFFLINLAKLPMLWWAGMSHQKTPFLTIEAFKVALLAFPAIAIGALVGRVAFKVFSESAFRLTVLIFASLAAIQLIASYWLRL